MRLGGGQAHPFREESLQPTSKLAKAGGGETFMHFPPTEAEEIVREGGPLCWGGGSPPVTWTAYRTTYTVSCAWKLPPGGLGGGAPQAAGLLSPHLPKPVFKGSPKQGGGQDWSCRGRLSRGRGPGMPSWPGGGTPEPPSAPAACSLRSWSGKQPQGQLFLHQLG